MNKITQSLTLDLVEVRHNIINARQGDQLVRDLTITITNNGHIFPIPEDADVRLRGARPDGKYVLYDCTDSLDEQCAITDKTNGIVHVPIPDFLLSSSGRAYLDIGIYQDVDGQKTEVASTEKFVLYIPEKIFSEEDVVNSHEGSTLSELIRATKELDDKVSKNEDIRIVSENTRMENENERISEENARKSNETNRQDNETARLEAEKSRNNAENERISAENMRNEAENTRLKDEDTRKSNESERQTGYADMLDKINNVQELVNGLNDMTGSTAESDGIHGFVPAPPASSASLFLKNDGSWGVPESSPQVRVDSIVLDSILLNQSLLASRYPSQKTVKKIALKPDTNYTLFFNGVKLTAIPNIMESWGYRLNFILRDSSSGTDEIIREIATEREDNLTNISNRLSKNYIFDTTDILEPSLEIIFEWRGQLKPQKAISSTSYIKNGVTVSGLGNSFVWDKSLSPAEGFSLDVTGLTWDHLTMAYESSSTQALDGVIYPILLHNDGASSSFKSGFEVTRNGDIITVYYRHFPADANGSSTFKFYFDDSYNTVVVSVQRPVFTNNATPYHLSLKYTTEGLDLSDINEEINTLKKSVSDGKGRLASAITALGVTTASDAAFDTLVTNVNNITPAISGSWSGATFTATAKIGENAETTSTTLGGNVTAPHVLTGYTFSSENAGRNISGTMENKGYPEVGSMTQSTNTTITNATYNESTGRFDSNLNGSGYYTGAYFYVPNCTPANIKAGVKVGGKNSYITGSYVSRVPEAATKWRFQGREITPCPYYCVGGMAVYMNAHIYVLGGSNSSSESKKVYRYSIYDNSWSKMADYPTTNGVMTNHNYIIEKDSRLVPLGKFDYSGNTFITPHAFNPVINTWTSWGTDCPAACHSAIVSNLYGYPRFCSSTKSGSTGLVYSMNDNGESYTLIGDFNSNNSTIGQNIQGCYSRFAPIKGGNETTLQGVVIWGGDKHVYKFNLQASYVPSILNSAPAQFIGSANTVGCHIYLFGNNNSNGSTIYRYDIYNDSYTIVSSNPIIYSQNGKNTNRLNNYYTYGQATCVVGDDIYLFGNYMDHTGTAFVIHTGEFTTMTHRY